MQSQKRENFFETDAEAGKRQRRAAKAGNDAGKPLSLRSKLLAAVRDPSSWSSLFVAESSGTVRRVDVETRDAAHVYRGPSAPVTCVAVGGPGNQSLFAGSWDKAIWTWHVGSREVGRKFIGHSDFVKAVVCARLGGQDILISGGADKKIMVWDVATGARLHILQDQTVPMMAVQHLAIDPVQSVADETIAISASSDPHLRRWRIRLDLFEQMSDAEEPGAARHAILEHETTVYRLFFETGGDEVDLWTASGDGTAKCLSRARAFATSDTFQHGDHVRAVAVNDQWVITGGRDEDIKVWDRATGEMYGVLAGHYDEVTDLVTMKSPAGAQQVVSVSIDGTVRTWPLERKALDDVLRDQQDKARGVVQETSVETEPLMTAEEEAELAALMDES